jgi:hypothetical protein
MHEHTAALAADREFFSALIARRVEALEKLLADDFTLVALDGAMISKRDLVAAVGSGQLRFHAIEPAEAQVRFFDTVSVVTGRTQMRVQLGDNTMEFASRYTHVFAEREGAQFLVAAQGTPIQAA